MSDTPQSRLAVLDDPQGVRAVMPPLRRRILAHLHERPDSASGIAREFGLTRQKTNYHVRSLEKAGLLELASEKQRRGCTERFFRPAARAYLIDPDLLGGLDVDTETLRDRFSSAYLLRLAARLVRDVARLRRGAERRKKRLATFALQVDIDFKSPAERTAFAEELTESVALLARRYQNDSSGSRPYRFIIGGHVPPKTEPRTGGNHDEQH